MPYVNVKVEEGELRGMESAGVTSFLGVPYGASTAGPNRFRPPQPAPAWDGTRDALAFGPSSPQGDARAAATGGMARLLSLLYPRAGWPLEGASASEDCLRLNIWAPSEAQDRDLPVLVWLHGGGFYHGTGNEMAFAGDVLAAAGDMIVVTVTHRVGVLGFLDLRELGEPGSANAGMLDIVAALGWVRRNIGRFGGDASRVTICGQSGGGYKVSVLNAMPSARDRFARSIIMSGPFGRLSPPSRTTALRAELMSVLGCTSVADLRSEPASRLVRAQAETLARLPDPADDGSAYAELEPKPGFAPSLDAGDIPAHPFADMAADGFAGKQVLMGWTTHEWGMFLLIRDPSYSAAMTAERAAARVAAMGHGGPAYADLAARYPDEPPHLLYARRASWGIETSGRRLADLAAAKADGVWVYQFQQPTEVMGGILGACHSLDLAYVFGTVDRIPLTGRNPARIETSRSMMRAWAAFAHEGDPGWERWAPGGQPHPFGTPYGPGLHLPPDTAISAPVR